MSGERKMYAQSINKNSLNLLYKNIYALDWYIKVEIFSCT